MSNQSQEERIAELEEQVAELRKNQESSDAKQAAMVKAVRDLLNNADQRTPMRANLSFTRMDLDREFPGF